MLKQSYNNKSKNEIFSELYNENFSYVYSFVFIRTAYDAQMTEEIVQETFMAAWLGQEKFQQKSSCRTWLCAIGKKKLYEYYRKNIPRENNLKQDNDDIAEQYSDFDLENIVLKHEAKKQIVGALNQINPTYRYVLIMKYIDGYTVKEIAGNIGRTAKAVDGMLQKAKTNFIREYLRIERRGNSHE